MMSMLGNIGVIFARKWIAGTRAEDAINAAIRINALGEKAILNYLGENFSSVDDVNRSVATYAELIKDIRRNRIDAQLSVKPTQLGLVISRAEFYKNYIKVVDLAASNKIFVWLDAEEAKYADDTIGAYLKALGRRNNIGICVQANLKRSYDDLKRIVARGGVVRLVKGAYTESSNVAFSGRAQKDANYVKLMQYLFTHASSFMIATHDEKMIKLAIDENQRRRRRVMFGMLKGIRPKLALSIANRGYSMYIYVPFGKEWLAYSLRRLREAGHANLILRSIFQGG